MTHLTERVGSPRTLVCTKTRRTYETRCQQYAHDIGHFKTLAALAGSLPPAFQDSRNRIQQAIRRANH